MMTWFLNNRRKNASSARSGEAGFSVLELVIVLIIGGLMFIPIYAMMMQVIKLKPEENRFEVIQKALAEHLRVTGTLPCPADPRLDVSVTDVAYSANCAAVPVVGGVAIGAVPIDNLRAATNCDDDLSVLNVGGDVLGALRSNIFMLREHITGEAATMEASANLSSNRPDDILCPSRDYIADDNGYKFIYAVTFDATVTGFDIFDRTLGSVVVLNQAGVAATVNPQLYVLVSTGDDNKGAYGLNGALSGSACDLAAGLDAENCNNDEVFLAMPRVEVPGAGYFDDQVDFGIGGYLTEDSFWRWGNTSADGRDMILGGNKRLLIGPSSGAIEDTDAFVVNGGTARITGDVRVESQTTLTTSANVEVNEEINAMDVKSTGGFCYCPPLLAAQSGDACYEACD